ncbi:MAG: hypothetical protein RLZZ582_2090 [Verrucomicrobiota bacterium]|jgi:uncharacterized phosphosugar-binding protein
MAKLMMNLWHPLPVGLPDRVHSVIADYLDQCRSLLDAAAAQEETIAEAASLFAETILAGRMVHCFGSGHSRILVEEMWPRYGSFPGFNPIVELSLSFHNLVVGANGQRQAMFLENVHGLAARILRNYDLSPKDTALVASSSGCNLVPIEMAEEFKRRGVKVVAIISKAHSEASRSQRRDGRKLQDFADIVLDTGAPAGDAMIEVPGLETPVGPGSTIGGCMLINAIKVEVAALLTEAGKPPTVLTAPALVGNEKASQLFESAYDEHARRLSKLYAHIGEAPTESPAARPRRDGRPERSEDRPREDRGQDRGSDRGPERGRNDGGREERVRNDRGERSGSRESGRESGRDGGRGRGSERDPRGARESSESREIREPREQREVPQAAPVREVRDVRSERPERAEREPREEYRSRSGERSERSDRGGDRSEGGRPPRRMEEPSERPQRASQPQVEPTPVVESPAPSAPVEVPKPANWDRMDDIERRLWLRENGQAPVPAPRAEGGERRGREDRGRDDRGRDSGNRRGGRGRRH